MKVEYTVRILVEQPEDAPSWAFGEVGDVIPAGTHNAEIIEFETLESEIVEEEDA